MKTATCIITVTLAIIFSSFASVEAGTYTVRKGDSLWSISNDLQIPRGKIQQWNKGVDFGDLRPGLKIHIFTEAEEQAARARLEAERAELAAEKAEFESNKLQVAAEKFLVDSKKAQVAAERAAVTAERAVFETKKKNSYIYLSPKYQFYVMGALIVFLPLIGILLAFLCFNKKRKAKKEISPYKENVRTTPIHLQHEDKSYIYYAPLNQEEEGDVFMTPRVTAEKSFLMAKKTKQDARKTLKTSLRTCPEKTIEFLKEQGLRLDIA